MKGGKEEGGSGRERGNERGVSTERRVESEEGVVKEGLKGCKSGK